MRQTPSQQDSREKQLTLTTFGEKAVARLNTLSTKQLEEMFADLSDPDRKTLAASSRRFA